MVHKPDTFGTQKNRSVPEQRQSYGSQTVHIYYY
jgi:hypothetical protein